MLRRAGEAQLLLVYLARGLRNVHCVVADAFKIAEGMQVFRHTLVLLARKLAFGYAHEVGSEPVLVPVDQFLLALNVRKSLVAVCLEQCNRREEVILRGLPHILHSLTALLHGKRRMRKEAFVKPVECVDTSLLLLALYQRAGQLFKQADGRKQCQSGHEAECRVHKRYADGVHRHVHECKAYRRVRAIEQPAAEYYADKLYFKICKGGAPAVGFRIQRRQQHRHSRADRDAEDDRIRSRKADRARDGQCLKDAGRSARALQNAGEKRARQYAEKRI